jgi:transposase-like protein
MNDKILFLYAQGMTTREIVATFKEMYGASVSASLISKVIEDEAVLALNQFSERWDDQGRRSVNRGRRTGRS